MVGYPRPDEVVVPLRRDEFDTLCDGNTSEERANRDVCLGIAAASLVGLAGAFAAAVPAWGDIWKFEHNSSWVFLTAVLVLFAATVGFGVAAYIFDSRATKTLNNSPFSRVRARLLGLFDEHQSDNSAT